MNSPGRAILLAVGGGIAAYKAAALCSRLTQAGHEVRVAMSRSSRQFVGVNTFSALSGKPVGTDDFDPQEYPLGAHIELVSDVDLMVVAPATANLIGKFAGGIADCLISTTYLQVTCPVLLAPAMSDPMWKSPAVARNVEILRQDGCFLIGPESGWLSCRVQGEGRMSEPEAIFEVVREIL